MSAVSRVFVFVGSYTGSGPTSGGISVFQLEPGDTIQLTATAHFPLPGEAGYLLYAPATRMLYAVDERKTDGRGPVGPPAAVHAFRVDSGTGALQSVGSVAVPGPFPTYLALDEARGRLFTANHGSFDHVEHVVRTTDGWEVDYLYDDSTVVQIDLAADGSLTAVSDVYVLQGHGHDPNGSQQVSGHGQASAHAHSVVVDPSGRFLLVPDKGTDQILVLRLGQCLELAGVRSTGAETGPRHLVFDPETSRAYVTYEFSSEVASFQFDSEHGTLQLIGSCSSVGGPVGRTNEPADIRLHPSGRTLYVNNRGEDTIAWFRVSQDGSLTRSGDVRLAASIHPGVAARSIALSPDGAVLLVTDRPAGLVRAYDVDPDTGALSAAAQVAVAEPAFVIMVELS